jgi:hypothetical protein
LLAGLTADVQRVAAEKIDHAYIQSQEFHDLLWSALTASARAREREKIRFNARVVAGAIQLDARQQNTDDDPQLFIDIISSLDGPQLRVLRGFIATQFSSAPRQDQSIYDWAYERTSPKLYELVRPMRTDDMIFHVHRLVGAGCVQQLYSDAPNGPKHPAYMLHNVVHRMLHWLEKCGGYPSEGDIAQAARDAGAVE